MVSDFKQLMICAEWEQVTSDGFLLSWNEVHLQAVTSTICKEDWTTLA